MLISDATNMELTGKLCGEPETLQEAHRKYNWQQNFMGSTRFFLKEIKRGL